MYYRHFRLSGAPFQLMPSAAVLYLGKSHRECLAALEWALVHEPSGFMLLTGAQGTGKTTLLCAILKQRFANLRIAYVTNPKLSFEEILRVVLMQFAAPAPQEGKKLDLIQAFEQALANQPEGQRTVIIIDEAQDMSADALADFRLLVNSNGSEERPLEVILVGQPELVDNLGTVRERVGAKAVLAKLTPEESIEYVEYRMRAKGGEAGAIFESRALRYLVRASGGIPRRINVLSHNSMLSAYSEGSERVTMKMVAAVVKDYNALFNPRKRKLSLWKESINRVVEKTERKRTERADRPWRRPAFTLTALFLLAMGAVLGFAETRPGLHLIKSKAEEVAKIAKVDNIITIPPLHPATTIPKASATTPPVAASSSAPPENAGASESVGAIRGEIRVRHGDTMGTIAARYLGSKDWVGDLIDANPQIRNPNRLFPGQIVYIPKTEIDAE